MASFGLAALGGWFESLPFETLLIGHCLQISSMVLPMRGKYLLSYWVSSLLNERGLPSKAQNLLRSGASRP